MYTYIDMYVCIICMYTYMHTLHYITSHHITSHYITYITYITLHSIPFHSISIPFHSITLHYIHTYIHVCTNYIYTHLLYIYIHMYIAMYDMYEYIPPISGKSKKSGAGMVLMLVTNLPASPSDPIFVEHV